MSKLERGLLVLAIMVVHLYSDHVAEAANCVVGRFETGYWSIAGAVAKFQLTNCTSSRKNGTLVKGDTLEFKYSDKENVVDNVVGVGKSGYTECTTKYGKGETYTSGDDKIPLGSGMNYFITTKFRVCQRGGVKIAVKAR